MIVLGNFLLQQDFRAGDPVELAKKYTEQGLLILIFVILVGASAGLILFRKYNQKSKADTKK